MNLTFQWEPLAEALKAPNLSDLLREHHADLGVQDGVPLKPDFIRMRELAALGIYRLWTARDGPTLAGYIAWYIQRHLHYSGTVTAFDDLFMLSSEYRRGLNGYRMFRSNLDALRELGVQRAIITTKVHFERNRGGLEKMMTRLGFVKISEVWDRML